jgi:hypothetical protein
MKHGIFLALLIAGSFLFSSCEKGDKVSLIRIASETSSENGETVLYYVYTYDDQGYLTNSYCVEGTGGSYSSEVITYSNNLVTSKEYINGNDTPYVCLSYLNAKGYIDSLNYSFDDQVIFRGNYGYDGNGYLVSENLESFNSSLPYVFTAEYTIENGNKVNGIYKTVYYLGGTSSSESSLRSDIAVSHSVLPCLKDVECKTDIQKAMKLPKLKMINQEYAVNDTAFYEFSDSLNNISSENRGIFWKGVQNKNLVKTQVRKSNGDTTYNYVYEFDEEGRVTRQSTVGNGAYVTDFTYSDKTFYK